MDLSKLYPQITYPVSNQTKRVGEIVLWDHSDNYDVGLSTSMRYATNEKKYTITLNSNEFRHLENYEIDGKKIIPITVYLVS